MQRNDSTTFPRKSLPECFTRIQMSHTAKSWRKRSQQIRKGNRIDTTTKLRNVIEKTLDFLPNNKEKKDIIKKDLPENIPGTSHRCE